MVDGGQRVDSIRSVFDGASVFVAGKILYNILTFLFNIVLTRYLGASVYGLYALGQTIVDACRTFTNLGADKSVLRYVPTERERDTWQSEIVTLSVITSVLGGGIIGAVIYVSAPTISNLLGEGANFTVIIRLFIPILILTTLSRLIGNTFRALDRPEYEVFFQRIIFPGLNVTLAGLMLLLGYSLEQVMYALIFSAMLTLLTAGYLLYTVTDIQLQIGLSRDELVEYYNYSLPLTMKDAGSFLYTRIDVLMVGFFLSSSTVGIYNIAILVAGILMLPLQAVNQVFPAVASRLYSSDRPNDLTWVYATATRWVVTASLPTAVFIVIYNAEILGMFGSEFHEATWILLIFVLGQFLNTVAGPSGYVLMMTDHQYLVSINQWIFGILNVVLNYVLLVQIGLLGAAVATAIVLGSLNIVRVIQVWYLENMHPYRCSYLKPVASTVVSGAGMMVIWFLFEGVLALFVGGIIGVTLYFGTLIQLGIESGDRELINDAVYDIS